MVGLRVEAHNEQLAQCVGELDWNKGMRRGMGCGVEVEAHKVGCVGNGPECG
jgi:hypothetical protein